MLITDCLATISRPSEFPLEIIVVDNNSGDKSREIICERFPYVKWIQMTYNSGFARANNEGMRHAGGEIILLLNSDTLSMDKAVERCCEEFAGTKFVACGAQLLNEDGSPQISGNYFVRGSLNNLLALPYTGRMVKFFGTLFGVQKPHVADSSSIVRVDWINGAFLMVKKEIIEKAGMMDEDFFLYAEESEWCHRIGKFGELAVFGHYKVIHLQGESSGSAFQAAEKGYSNLHDKKGLQLMLSNMVRIRKQNGVSWFLFNLFIYSVTVPFSFAGATINNLIKLKNPASEFELLSGFGSNVRRLWAYTLKIISNKPFFYKVL